MVDVEDGLDFVVISGKGGEGVGIGEGVGVEFDGAAGVEVVNFLSGYGGVGGTEFLDVDFFVAGAVFEEDEESAADGAGCGVGQLHAEDDVGGNAGLGAG
jgi:hypothetical protein